MSATDKMIKPMQHIVTRTSNTLLITAISLLTLSVIFSPANANESSAPLYEIRIPMELGQPVTIYGPDGIKTTAGNVEALPETTRWPSYSASAWGTPGEVCAAAVNALHMLVSVEKGKGRTLSIIPRETVAPAAGAGASVVISSRAGSGIFGAWAPSVGSKVSLVKKADGKTYRLSAVDLPRKGDTVRGTNECALITHNAFICIKILNSTETVRHTQWFVRVFIGYFRFCHIFQGNTQAFY